MKAPKARCPNCRMENIRQELLKHDSRSMRTMLHALQHNQVMGILKGEYCPKHGGKVLAA